MLLKFGPEKLKTYNMLHTDSGGQIINNVWGSENSGYKSSFCPQKLEQKSVLASEKGGAKSPGAQMFCTKYSNFCTNHSTELCKFVKLSVQTIQIAQTKTTVPLFKNLDQKLGCFNLC